VTRGLGLLGALLAGWAGVCDSGGDELRLVGTVERTLLEIVAPGDLLVPLDPALAEAEARLRAARERLADLRLVAPPLP